MWIFPPQSDKPEAKGSVETLVLSEREAKWLQETAPPLPQTAQPQAGAADRHHQEVDSDDRDFNDMLNRLSRDIAENARTQAFSASEQEAKWLQQETAPPLPQAGAANHRHQVATARFPHWNRQARAARQAREAARQACEAARQVRENAEEKT